MDRVILVVDSVLADDRAKDHQELYTEHLSTIPGVELVFTAYRADAMSILGAGSSEISLVIIAGLVPLAKGSTKKGTASFVTMLRHQVAITCPIIAHTSDVDQRNALMQPGLCNRYVDKGAGFEWPQLVRAVRECLELPTE